jgi:excisionase family DNA binding protein
MRYIIHMSEEELEKLVDQVMTNRISNVEKALSYLTEQRDNEFLKMPEVCKILDVTDRTIRNWVRKNKLRCYWIGDRQFFRMKDILDAMTTNF